MCFEEEMTRLTEDKEQAGGVATGECEGRSPQVEHEQLSLELHQLGGDRHELEEEVKEHRR